MIIHHKDNTRNKNSNRKRTLRNVYRVKVLREKCTNESFITKAAIFYYLILFTFLDFYNVEEF